MTELGIDADLLPVIAQDAVDDPAIANSLQLADLRQVEEILRSVAGCVEPDDPARVQLQYETAGEGSTAPDPPSFWGYSFIQRSCRHVVRKHQMDPSGLDCDEPR